MGLTAQAIEENYMTERHALVLGGGGVAGIAWMTGLLAGLAEAGDDVTGADVIIGTSAGATVAAQLGSGLALPELFARQAEPARQSAEIGADLDLEKFGAEVAAYLAGATSPGDTLRRIGAYALDAQTVPEAARRAVIESRLPSHDWPARDIQLVAVEAVTGEMRVFDAQSGVPLVDAVAASCAVPGIWPPVTIGGLRYIDGGVRSSDNADLAAGAERITVISPLGYDSPVPSPLPLRDVVSKLRDAGSGVTVIGPDATSLAAISVNPLDPATRTPAAQAGRAQGLAGLAASATD
jgi:NTE family protein